MYILFSRQIKNISPNKLYKVIEVRDYDTHYMFGIINDVNETKNIHLCKVNDYPLRIAYPFDNNMKPVDLTMKIDLIRMMI